MVFVIVSAFFSVLLGSQNCGVFCGCINVFGLQSVGDSHVVLLVLPSSAFVVVGPICLV